MEAITVDSDFSQLPRVSPPTFIQNVAANILAPFAALQQGLSTTFTPFERNCIKRPAPPPDKANRITRISKDIPLKEFKNRCYDVKCTLNEAS